MIRGNKSIYIAKHPEKYIGDVNNIICRSNWERQFCLFLDNDERIVKWGSEPFPIMYRNPVKRRMARYFVDFIIVAKQKDGKEKTFVVEIKPSIQTKAPETKKRTRKAVNEALTFAINSAKWEMAQKYCAERGWTFLILTEENARFLR